MSKLNEIMNYNRYSREKSGKSMLPEIESELMKAFSKMDSTKEMQESFFANIVTTPEVFENPEMYRGLENLREPVMQMQTYLSTNAQEIAVESMSKTI